MTTLCTQFPCIEKLFDGKADSQIAFYTLLRYEKTCICSFKRLESSLPPTLKYIQVGVIDIYTSNYNTVWQMLCNKSMYKCGSSLELGIVEGLEELERRVVQGKICRGVTLLLIAALLICNSYTIQFTHLKVIV